MTQRRALLLTATATLSITGYALSSNFPVTAGAYDQTHNGGPSDVFVTKLNSTGTALIYSTFIGGSSDDIGRSISVDGSGNAYVTGDVVSSNFPTTAGAYDQTHNGGTYDVFVTKLNPSGNALVYSTFIGGNGNDEARGITLDGNGNAYITGYASNNFPVTLGAYDQTHNGNYDVFVTKLNSTGSSLMYSTFVGGTGNEGGLSIALDNNNRAYITGFTQSTGYPTSTGAYDVTHNGGDDVFVTKLALCVVSSATISAAACGSYTSPSGSHVYTSTGIYQDTLVNATGCDSLLTIYLTVNSVPNITANSGAICMGASFTIIATGSAISYTYSGGSAVVNPATNTAYTVTGTNAQGCTGIAISNVTVNALPPVSITGGGTICVNQTTLLNASGASTYTWSTGENSANITVSPSLTTNYSVQGTDNNGCQNSANVTLSVDECTGVNELKIGNDELKIYPNPVNEILNVSPLTPKGGTVEVFNMLGSIVLEQTITPPLEGKGEATIHVGELEKGIYFIKVGNETRKFVKE
ncbi:MAG: SBBP repeat-containing protein [Bacteroidetes bacterium]|nr:SBBP repeat-containing protein [Bacteroidota bacterium]